jgi:hypothetical protein
MSFNKKTVNQLSDTQMADLKSEINAAAAANAAPAVDLSGVMSGLGSLQTGQGGINTNIQGVGDSVATGFSDLQTLIDRYNTTAGAERAQLGQNQMAGFTQMNNLNQGRADLLGQQITGVGDDVTQGFADQTTRFDTLDTSVGGVQDTVSQNNSDLAAMSTEMDNRFNTTDQNFIDAGNALTEGFTANQDDIAEAQRLNLEGQGDILSDLKVAATDRNTYFDTLSGNQNTMLDNQADYASNFDTYVQRYGDDTALQNETLGGIQSGLTNFAGDVNKSIGDLGTLVNAGTAATEKSGNEIRSALEGGFRDVGGGFAQLANDQLNMFDQSQQALTGFNNAMTRDIDQANNQANTQYDQITGQLKTLSQLSSLPTEMRQQFGQLSNAFDSQGNLIANSIDDQGNTITRQLDDQGNMILRRFDAQGNSLGIMNINMAQAMEQIRQLEMLPGASAGMGNLSAPLQDMGNGSGGFVNPYGITQ